MNRWSFVLPLVFALPVAAQQSDAPTQLTIYNQDFAVARTTVPLDLHSGSNEVLTTNVTSQLEPDSVILRDPTGRSPIHVGEQNYDAGVVTQAWLLDKYEGKTLDFQTYGPHMSSNANGDEKVLPPLLVKGRIVRAGDQPLIEVDGHLQFQLPGLPIFPADTEGLLLKPTLRWQIQSAAATKFNAELDYITRGMSWQATYNVVVPEAADVTGPEVAEVVGWVTIQNNSGTDFPQATIQLMAGDVAKLRDVGMSMGGPMARNSFALAASDASFTVTQKEFDDFHLYDLHRTVSLRNHESKQVQFLEAAGVTVQRNYQFEGNAPITQPMYAGYHNDQRNFGGGGNTHVAIREEIKNSTANHLGMPLPAGRLRLYRREASGQMQFVGESMVQHTPAGQTVQVVSGNAFDLTAERRQTDFHIDQQGHNMDETFAIKLSNAKSQPVTVHVVEHLNRAVNWQITEKSADYTKKDSTTVDFSVQVPASGDITLNYSVHYSWD
jgi:hypothetical protein